MSKILGICRIYKNRKKRFALENNREVEKESIEMERLRDERMSKGKKSVKNQPNPTPKKYVRQAQINMVAEDSDPFSSDDEEVTTDFSEEEVDEEANHWIFTQRSEILIPHKIVN